MDLGVSQTTEHACKTQVLILRGFLFYDIGWHTDTMKKDETSLPI